MYNKKIQVSWHPLKKNYLPSNVEFAFSSPNNKAEEVGAYMYTLNSPPQSASLVSPSYNAAGCDCRFETAAFCAPLVLSRLNDCHSLRRIYARKVCVCVCMCECGLWAARGRTQRLISGFIQKIRIQKRLNLQMTGWNVPPHKKFKRHEWLIGTNSQSLAYINKHEVIIK